MIFQSQPSKKLQFNFQFLMPIKNELWICQILCYGMILIFCRKFIPGNFCRLVSYYTTRSTWSRDNRKIERTRSQKTEVKMNWIKEITFLQSRRGLITPLLVFAISFEPNNVITKIEAKIDSWVMREICTFPRNSIQVQINSWLKKFIIQWIAF